MEIKKKLPTAIAGSVSYIALTLLFLTVGAYTQKLNIYFGIFFTQVFIFGLYVVLVSKFQNYDLRETMGLNMPLRGTLWKAFFIAIISYPVIVFFNVIYLYLLKDIITIPENAGVPLPDTFGKLIVSIFMFALLPGIFEELLFRGFFFKAFYRFKPRGQIFITALLFGIFHYNPTNFIGPFIMGLTFGYMRYRSNSLLPSMIAHTTNNSIAMILGYIAMQSQNAAASSDIEMEVAEIEAMMGDAQALMVILGLGIMALLAFGFYKMLKKYPDYSENITYVFEPEKQEKRSVFVMILFGFAVFFTVFALLAKMS